MNEQASQSENSLLILHPAVLDNQDERSQHPPSPHDVRLLDYIVDALIRRHGIVASDLTIQCDGKTVPVNQGWDGKVERLALAKARTLAPETLGRIVYAIPDAALYFVHCGTWLGKYESGPYLLQQIAATAMVCRIRAKLGVASGVMDFTPHQTGEAA